MNFAQLKERWSRLAQSDHGRRVANITRIVAVVGVGAYLIYRLSEIGWADLWASLPNSVGYFLLLPVLYMILPVSEALIYRKLWSIRIREAVLASLKKRVLNNDIVSYSGEVQFYLWARKRVSQRGGRVLHDIKDNLIISSVTSVSTAVLIVGAFALTGQISMPGQVGSMTPWHLGGLLFLAVLLVAAIVRLRKAIFSLPPHTLGFLFLIHTARFTVGSFLLILQWWSVLPDVPFQTWAVLLTASVLVDRLPIIPSKDLLAVGVGIQLSTLLDVPAATIAGLFLVRIVFDKMLNLTLFAATAFYGRKPALTRDDDGQAAETLEPVATDVPLAHAA